MANYNPPTGGFNVHPENANRSGRPKRGWTWKDLLEKAAEEMVDLRDKDGNIAGKEKLKNIVAKKVWVMAADGDMQAIKEIFDRMDGKPAQENNVNHSGNITVSFHTSLKQAPIENPVIEAHGTEAI